MIDEEKIYAAARAAHEVNRAYCRGLGDYSQRAWGDAPLWQVNSAIAGVRMIAANPSTTPRESHEAWLALKLSEGWAYGATKDPEARLHPCCVPYDELPPEQRTKDVLFGATVRGVLGLTG